MDRLTRTSLSNLMLVPFWALLMFGVGIAFAWVPMLGWNLGLHSVFPTIVPKIGFWQAFWMTVFFGWVIHKPTVSVKD